MKKIYGIPVKDISIAKQYNGESFIYDYFADEKQTEKIWTGGSIYDKLYFTTDILGIKATEFVTQNDAKIKRTLDGVTTIDFGHIGARLKDYSIEKYRIKDSAEIRRIFSQMKMEGKYEKYLLATIDYFIALIANADEIRNKYNDNSNFEKDVISSIKKDAKLVLERKKLNSNSDKI